MLQSHSTSQTGPLDVVGGWKRKPTWSELLGMEAMQLWPCKKPSCPTLQHWSTSWLAVGPTSLEADPHGNTGLQVAINLSARGYSSHQPFNNWDVHQHPPSLVLEEDKPGTSRGLAPQNLIQPGMAVWGDHNNHPETRPCCPSLIPASMLTSYNCSLVQGTGFTPLKKRVSGRSCATKIYVVAEGEDRGCKIRMVDRWRWSVQAL